MIQNFIKMAKGVSANKIKKMQGADNGGDPEMSLPSNHIDIQT